MQVRVVSDFCAGPGVNVSTGQVLEVPAWMAQHWASVGHVVRLEPQEEVPALFAIEHKAANVKILTDAKGEALAPPEEPPAETPAEPNADPGEEQEPTEGEPEQPAEAPAADAEQPEEQPAEQEHPEARRESVASRDPGRARGARR